MLYPGKIAMKALQIALHDASVPVQEEPPGSNKGPRVDHYLRAAGVDPGESWCMAAVFCWLWEAASLPSGDFRLPLGFPRTASTVEGADWAQQNGLWIGSPNRQEQVQIGDLIFFYHESMGRIAHVGMVKGLMAEGLRVVAGNTNKDGSREGYEVAINLYPWATMDARTGMARIPF